MAITALPPAPSRSSPVDFADKADAWVAALDLFTSEANALQTDVNTKQTDAATSATSAATSASNAATSATSASNSATTAASAAGAAMWVSGNNYAQYAAATSPITLLSYRARVALTPSTIDPSADSTNWRILNGVTFVQIVTTTSVTAVAGGHYILTNVASSSVTMPATAFSGDEIWITVANNLETNNILRNGLTIMGLAENVIIDNQYITVRLRYVNSSWRMI